ncbi:MAG: L,D-transpeptidase family protein [Ardenticatenaceae bacterium]|nr:L,D-transpeptidase family protein [Ardenticatenaceae bacterium]
MDSTTLLKQAHNAIKAGDKSHARQLLQEAVRQDAQDYRGWLWLASLTASPQASLEYVNRAEMLNPNNPHVQKARAWAEARVLKEQREREEERGERREGLETAVSQPSTTPPRNWRKLAVRTSGALLLILFVVTGVFLIWNSWFNPLPADVTIAADVTGGEMAAVIATATPETIVPTVTPTLTAVALQPKNLVANSDHPRATWTLTPTPTDTPIPTDTPPPTYISESGGNSVRGRPLGVGPNERWIDVDLTTQTLVAYEGNESIFETLISSGTWEHPTVTGQFRIWLKYEAQTMDGSLLGYDYYLENVPYVMYFYNDYALHGTFWHSNFGTPMSHGCVNMETSDAQWVFSWAGIGTVVNVHY